MNKDYDPQNNHAPSLRADPQDQQKTSADFDPAAGHTGLQGTASGLLRSTLIAAGAALVLLVTVVLPSEYNVDPLGIGSLLGLTEMGEIKTQLHAEAAADAATQANGPVNPPSPEISGRLAAIEDQLAEITAILAALPAKTAPSPVAAPPPPAAANSSPPVATAPAPAKPAWRDEMDLVLSPGQGVELKLVMDEGGVAEFEWTANGSVLNYDTHGDGSGRKISYEKGRKVPGQTDKLTAAFTGNHGWFFRNRTRKDVTLTLRVRGDYKELIRTY